MLKFKFSGEFEVDPTKLQPIFENGNVIGFRDNPEGLKEHGASMVTHVALGVQWRWPDGLLSSVTDFSKEYGIGEVQLVVTPTQETK